MAPNHFLDLDAFDGAVLRDILNNAGAIKSNPAGFRPLTGKTLAMIFERPSTRTRVSFDVAMRQLGGETIVLSGDEMQINRGESISDTAKVLSRYVDGIMIRILDHSALQELAEHATVPVINGLTELSHPCQVMADILTFEEHCGSISGKKIAWSGDVNNVLTSWSHAAKLFEFSLHVAAPEELLEDAKGQPWADQNSADIHLTTDPDLAVEDADCVVTDTWVSMGSDDSERRQNLLTRYRVDDRMMNLAKDDAIFMHCLPAHRGEEVTASVIDGPQSVVFDEAENRVHAQKAILAWCLSGPKN